MKKRLLIGMMLLTVVLFAGCGEAADSGANKDSKPQNTQKEEQKSGYAYDFATDNSNGNLFSVSDFPHLELYKVNLSNKLYCHYAMDSNGNTIIEPNGEYTTSDFGKYIYVSGNLATGKKATVVDTTTFEDVTPEAFKEGKERGIDFINKDILFCCNGAYDLKTGKALWSDIDLNMELPIFRSDELLVYTTYDDDKFRVCNYTTGQELTKDITEEYKQIQINGANYFCYQSNDMVKVYDNTGKYIHDFKVPEGFELARHVAYPGEHFAFYKSNNDEFVITDLKGKVVRENVFSDRKIQPYIDDFVIVTDTGKAGILDKDMNWIIDQTTNEYEYLLQWNHVIFEVQKPGDPNFVYNIETGVFKEVTGMDYDVNYDIPGNKLIRIDNKMYTTDDFELVDIEYKENQTYEQIGKLYFVEYSVEESKQINVYDYTGKKVKTVDLEDGEKYYVGVGNSILTLKQGKLKLVTF